MREDANDIKPRPYSATLPTLTQIPPLLEVTSEFGSLALFVILIATLSFKKRPGLHSTNSKL